ncbi:MAG: phosphopyruvate hydratase [Patescibacteria group bacterium]
MLKHTIHELSAREILDSRGDPTVEVKLELGGGVKAVASVPAGASVGAHEAQELRDGDSSRYNGKGVLNAVANIQGEIKQALQGISVTEQQEIDHNLKELDGTPNKSRLGANAILGVSLVCARAASAARKLPLYRYLQHVYKFPTNNFTLPLPMMNLLNGGRHADSTLNLQEIIIIPRRFRKIKGNLAIHFTECVRVGSEVFQALGRVLKKNGLDTDLGNEGGYAPNFKNSEQALDLLVQGINAAGFKPGSDATIGLDVAASEFYQDNSYSFEDQQLSKEDLMGRYHSWLERYPLSSIEDGLEQDDWQGWASLTEKFGKQLLLVGDDLFVTNTKRLKQGVAEGAANAIIIKPNQVGTLTETMETIKLARNHGYKIIVSHRSGETMDTFIADLAVAVGAQYLKAGSTARGERVTKYNRLMAIEAELLGS